MQGDPGFPDLVLARDGEVLFVELKSSKGKPTTEQVIWLNELGGGCVWRPDDWPRIQAVLEPPHSTKTKGEEAP